MEASERRKMAGTGSRKPTTTTKTSKSKTKAPKTASNAVASSSSSRKATSARKSKQPPPLPQQIMSNYGDEGDQSHDTTAAFNRTHINSETGHVVLDDDDEEDEMALYSPEKPIKPPQPQPQAKNIPKSNKTSSTSKSKAKKTSAKKAPASSSSSTVKASSVKSGTAKKVLGANKSQNSKRTTHKQDSSEEDVRVADEERKRKEKSRSPHKSKRPAALIDSSDEENDPQTSLPYQASRSAKGVPMPEEQIQTYLRNYDLEVERRMERMRNHLQMTVEGTRSKMMIMLSSWPQTAREMSFEDFIESCGADIEGAKKIVRSHPQGVPSSSSGADESHEWAEMKKKRIREKEEEEEQQAKAKATKSARRQKKATAATSTAGPSGSGRSTPQPSSVGSSTAASRARTRSTASNKPSIPSALNRSPSRANSSSIQAPSMPSALNRSPSRANSSSIQAPSSSRFSPQVQLPPSSNRGSSLASTPLRRTAATAQKRRVSRLPQVGDRIQYFSADGSPVTGILGEDGRVKWIEEDQDRENEPQAKPELPRVPSSSRLAANQPQSLPPSSPAPKRPSTYGYQASTAPIVFDGGSQPQQKTTASSDDSNELPDEEAEMQRFIAEEHARRVAAAAVQASKANTPASREAPRPTSSNSRLLGQSKSSFSRLKGALQHHPSSSSIGHPPSSPSRVPQPSSTRSSPTRSNVPVPSSSPSRGLSLRSPTRSPTGKSTASGGPPSKRLSLLNAKGEAVDLASVREEDLPTDQKANLWKLFGRLGFGGGSSSSN
ncbi:unnamed protein product [Sympodiomycopsis kandeliae]